MSREITPVNEGEHRPHPTTTSDSDPFKNYRMGADTSNTSPTSGSAETGLTRCLRPAEGQPLTRCGFSPDGQLNIPPLNYGDSSKVTATQPQTDSAGPKAGDNTTAKAGDNTLPKAGDNTAAKAGDNAVSKVSDGSTPKAGENTVSKASDGSTPSADGSTPVVANDGATPKVTDQGTTPKISDGATTPKVEASPTTGDARVSNQTTVTDNTSAPANAAAPAKQGYDHVVKHNDSLWKIAETSLAKNADHKATPNQIWNQVQNITHANKNEHPQLKKNPHMLHDGITLHVPEPNKGKAGQGAAAGDKQHSGERQQGTGRPHDTGRHHDTAKNHDPERQSRPAKPAHATPELPGRKQDNPRANDAIPANNGDQAGDGGRLVHAIKQLGRDIADTAVNIAHKLGTIGDCARGPRLAFKEQGFHLKPAVATEQGRQIRESGLFTQLKPGETPQPGDYGVRDWNRSVTRAHGGVNKGDSFIVTHVGKDGTMHGANDHRFVVPPDGGRYRNLQFYRPNAEFLRRYGNT